jgi:large subunit ribosomal protein L15
VRMNDLAPTPGSVHKKKRIARGNSSGHGTYSGRGIKGQKSRSGPDLRIGFEGGQIPLVRALSRKRGFNNRFRVEFEPINVGQLSKLSAGSSVTTESLREAGIAKSRLLPVKILGDGELSVKLSIEVERVSASAKAKIEAAGGSVTETLERKVKEVAEAPARRAVADDDDDEDEAPAAEAAPAAESGAEEEPKAARPRRTRAKASDESEESSEE